MSAGRIVPEPADEKGAYAVLYALLVVVLIGASAFVVDVSLMRESRATNRSAADAAVTAAAARLNQLNPIASNPRAACQTAWQYLVAGIPGLTDGSGACATDPETFPASGASCTITTAPKTVASTQGKWTVSITWPVPDRLPAGTPSPDGTPNPLLHKPDVYGSAPTQDPNEAFDGAPIDACSRIAVEVLQENSILLGAAIGFGGVVDTRAASVARSSQVGETNEVIAALNILEQHECAALTTAGNGSIEVNGVGGQAGVIAVESDAKSPERGNTCNGNNKVIDPLNNPNNFIRSNGPDGPGTGIIFSYALNGVSPDSADKAFNPAIAPPNGTVLRPTPTRLNERYGAAPVLDAFKCLEDCRNGGGDWIGNLVSAFGGAGVPTAYADAEPPHSTGAFGVLNNSGPHGFTCSKPANQPAVVVPPGNWFIDCASVSYNSPLIFKGGTIVSGGGIDIGSSGCLLVNIPVAEPIVGDACSPTIIEPADPVLTPVTTDPAPLGDAILYLRSGNLSRGATSKVYMPQTFTFITNGVTNLGGGDAPLLMTTPLGEDCSDDRECENRRFNRLVLWSESPSLHSIGGQGKMLLRGVLFTPNAQTNLGGQAGQNQTQAQFWARALRAAGQGTVTMSVDPEASIARPLLGVSLIR